jgi:hypothetical protein
MTASDPLYDLTVTAQPSGEPMTHEALTAGEVASRLAGFGLSREALLAQAGSASLLPQGEGESAFYEVPFASLQVTRLGEGEEALRSEREEAEGRLALLEARALFTDKGLSEEEAQEAEALSARLSQANEEEAKAREALAALASKGCPLGSD